MVSRDMAGKVKLNPIVSMERDIRRKNTAEMFLQSYLVCSRGVNRYPTSIVAFVII